MLTGNANTIEEIIRKRQRQRITAYQTKWYYDNREKVLKRQSEHYQQNKDIIKAKRIKNEISNKNASNKEDTNENT